MNGKQIGLGIVLLDFLGLTAYAVYAYGYVGFFEILLSNAVGLTALADLVISLSLILFWLSEDARDRGWSPIPYVVLTCALGSVGPLLYLIRRARAENAPAPAAKLMSAASV